MNTSHEQTERFLKGVVPPECESNEHRRRLREEVLAQLQARQSRAGIGRRWRIAALLLGSLCAAAVATEIAVQVKRYYFEGRDQDGGYHFATEPGNAFEVTYPDANGNPRTVSGSRGGVTSITSVRSELDVAEIERMRRDLEEIAALRQTEARELVGVIDTAVNARPLPRTCLFKYVLADGRTKTIGEGSPEVQRKQSGIPTEQDLKEMDALRQQGRRQIERITDVEHNGGLQRTLHCRYVLTGGREMSMGEGDPNSAPPTVFLTPEQLKEAFRLKRLGQGRALEATQKEVFGRIFRFQRFVVTLTDGTVVTYAEGEPQGLKTNLTKADWDELGKLMIAHSGKALDQYSEEVMGKPFQFTMVRYVLSDGTEVIHSTGKPSAER